MRLLNIHTLQLQEFEGTPPPYAIASHRWLDGEVTYQEMSQGRGREKKGYQKIQGFCNAVKRAVELSPMLKLSLQWLWIDTCCIDKTNSVELQEALNSMFKWYADAEICLALLHDVPSLDMMPFQTWQAVCESIWWTRGWTLQELLAPRIVLFYNGHWEALGHKWTKHQSLRFSAKALTLNLMNDAIARWTRIPADALADFSKAESLSLEERLSWMDDRKTSRIEDRVYCQLGIFGVFMPLIYGEGEHAMLRLEEALEQKRRRAERQKDQQPQVVVGLPEASKKPKPDRSTMRTFEIHYKVQSGWHNVESKSFELSMEVSSRFIDLIQVAKNELLVNEDITFEQSATLRHASGLPVPPEMPVGGLQVKELHMDRMGKRII